MGVPQARWMVYNGKNSLIPMDNDWGHPNLWKPPNDGSLELLSMANKLPKSSQKHLKWAAIVTWTLN